MPNNSMGAFIVLLFISIAHAWTPTCGDVSTNNRVDCYPQANSNQTACESRGCCWAAPSSSSGDKMGVPYCFYPSNFGYNLSSVSQTSVGVSGTLLRQSTPSPYGGDIATLQMEIRLETQTRIRFRLTDPNSNRFQVPIQTPTVTTKASNPIYNFAYTNFPFGVSVTRASTGTVIFNTTLGGLIYSDQFIQISSFLPSSILAGLGEHVSQFLLDLNWQQLSLWTRDQGTPQGQGFNLYGVHPFYVNVEKDGNVNGVFLLNSNAMDIILQPTPAITYRTVGGILDFYVFLGPTLDDVISQYTEVVGRPTMPPFWALGFHLCRWGYGSVNETQKINDQMRAAGVPQDVQWNDIDYMNKYLDFTYDPNAYAGLPQFVDSLHQQGQKYVMITDPGISDTQGSGKYKPYDDGISMDIFVKAYTGSPWQGAVWPGNCNFPNFFHPQAGQYWETQISTFHNQVSFDGLWIDMNEVALTGAYDACGNNKWTNPPYVPAVAGGSLSSDNICPDATDVIDSAGSKEVIYNLHSLYGYSEMVQTHNALQNILKKRTLVLSRSTYSGSGQYGAHWLGDNYADYTNMYYAIPGILSFNLFGIPLVGADICGFNGATTVELCSRWMEVGAFYPFSRNHNSIGDPDQDPVSLGPQVTNISRSILLTRYSLLPFLYTLFHHAHADGTPVARPLLAEFPADNNTYPIDKQFLWGHAFLVTPVLTQGATTVTGYFPASRWYDFFTGALLSGTGTQGKTITLDAPIDVIPLHVRGGYILPTQRPAITTTVSRTQPFSLIVALDANSVSNGDLFWDDGESLNTYENKQYTYVTFAASGARPGKLASTVVTKGYNIPSSSYLEGIAVFGLNYSPSSVSVGSTSITTFKYNANTQVLNITSLTIPIDQVFSVTWQ